MENRGSKTFCAPLSQDRVKLFVPPLPLLKSGNFLRPPFNIAKTSSYRIETTPKLVVLPFSMAKTLFAPAPLFIRVKLDIPPPPPQC